MADWSVERRLKAGFGALSGAVLVLAVAAVCAALLLKGQFGTYRGAAQATDAVQDMAGLLFEARLAAAAFQRARGDSPALRAEVARNLAEVRQVGTRLRGSAALGPSARAEVETVVASAARYAQGFADAAEHKIAKDAALDELGTAAEAAATALTGFMDASNRAGDAATTFSAARVQQALQGGRIALDRFVQTGDAEALARVQDGLGYATRQLAWMGTMMSDPERSDSLGEARALVETYAAGADSVVERHAAREAAREEMRAAEDAAEAAVSALVESLAATQENTGGLIAGTFTATILALAATAGLTQLGALALGTAVLRRIRADFTRALDTVGELAGGNLDVEIAGTHAQTEFGRLARALEVFRDGGREARRLAQAEEEARAARLAAERRSDEERRAADAERRDAEARAAEARKREIFEALRAAIDGVVASAGAGDFGRRVDPARLDPELRPLAEGINRLMENVDRGLAEISQVSARLAEGDLRRGMQGRFEGTFEALQHNIETMVGALGGLLSSVAAEADGLAGQSAEMTANAEDLARRAESQAASLEQTSAAMTQIAASADSNARSAAQTDAAASEMNREADAARSVLDGTVGAMRDIEEHAKQIEAIVDVIEDIAFQTNLLSLNASVEAARAGEAGKGFAVVANEVRALAQRSAEASAKVQQIISQSTGAISRGASAVDDTGAALSRIVDRIAAVSANLREIKASSDEQATAVKDISSAFGRLDKITQQNAAVAEETRGAAGLLAAQSERMQAAIRRVRFRDGASAPAQGPSPAPAAAQGTGAAA